MELGLQSVQCVTHDLLVYNVHNLTLTLNMNIFTVAVCLRAHCDLTCVLSGIRQSKGRERECIRIIANLCLNSAIILSPLVADSGIGASYSRLSAHKGTALPSNYSTSTVVDMD